MVRTLGDMRTTAALVQLQSIRFDPGCCSVRRTVVLHLRPT